MKLVFPFINLSLVLILTGCASVVSGTKQKVTINSTPPGAKVTVTDWKGTITETNTPALLRLKRGKGYFTGAFYKVRVEADGYKPSEMWLNPKLNGWYAGNVLLGGVIGLVLVDPATGAMYSLKPNKLDLVLSPSSVTTNTASLNTSANP